MLINCGNYFNDKAFNNLCAELENGGAVQVYIDCDGHTRNNNEQEAYRQELVKKYGDKLNTSKDNGNVSYCYTYELK